MLNQIIAEQSHSSGVYETQCEVGMCQCRRGNAQHIDATYSNCTAHPRDVMVNIELSEMQIPHTFKLFLDEPILNKVYGV